ncbi:MAG: energy-coupling factor transporter transmembrane protein EcfT [Ruminococcaceae bacterium]|nr:energy-coupling factor transporter transmembrane protein EcfT [Oscillospiraceae bacterium]
MAMKADIAFGQYCEGSSFLHRLDPRWKIVFALVYIVALFLAKNIFAFALIALSIVGLWALSGIRAGILVKGLRPLLFIIAFTAIINVFWFKGETPLLPESWFFQIYLEGIINAALIVLRVMVLVTGTSIMLTYTTTPIALTDGIEQLLAPLAKIKIPVHEFSMMMTIALRFIPTLIEETDKIMSAQKARGSDFSSGSLVQRAKALVPVLVPLFISAFRRAEDLATAMECRCYTGGQGRTRMNVLHSTWRDLVMFFIICAFVAGIVLLNIFAPGYVFTM